MTDHDDQDSAEALDDDKLGEDVDYPPERPLGVEDPTSDSRIRDSLASRDARRSSPRGDSVIDPRRVGRLVEPGADDDAEQLVDEEPDAIAHAVGEDEDLSAEEAAMHFEPEEPR